MSDADQLQADNEKLRAALRKYGAMLLDYLRHHQSDPQWMEGIRREILEITTKF